MATCHTASGSTIPFELALSTRPAGPTRTPAQWPGQPGSLIAVDWLTWSLRQTGLRIQRDFGVTFRLGTISMSAARPLSPGTRALPDHCHAAGRVTANNEWPELEYGVSLNEIVTRVTPPKVAGFLLVCSPTVRASHGIMFGFVRFCYVVLF